MGKKKGKGSGRNKLPEIVAPTPEQLAKATFEVAPVKTDKGQIVGRAYKRRPWFETLAAREEIGQDHLKALRFYRGAFEQCDYSETRCTLNRDPGGGSGEGASVRILNAKRDVRDCEAAVGVLVDVLSMVALWDKSFAEVAMLKYGSRDVDYIIEGVSVNKPAPRRKHVDLVKADFLRAATLLARHVEPSRLAA